MRFRLLLAVMGLAAATTHAATFTVTNLNPTGAGSLAQAITDANAAPGADTIVFGAGVTGTITLTTVLPRILDALTIQGPGSAALTIDGNAGNRIFSIVEATPPPCPELTQPTDLPVSISGMTLRNGRRNVADSVGGAIYSNKSLTVDDVAFINNRARGGGAIAFATQYPNQTLTVRNSLFSNNQATELVAPTVFGHAGGAISIFENCANTRTMPVTVTIADSDFFGNTAQAGGVNARGGGINFNGDADVTITRTTIEANKALPNPTNANVNAQGGGISGVSKTLTIRDSTINNNEAQRSAALLLTNEALVRQTFQERMVVQVVNSTISGNRAYEHRPVLVYANVEMKLYNSTLVGNRSDQNRTSGVYLSTGPTVPSSASDALAPTLALESSILWNPLGQADIGKDGVSVPGALAVTANNSSVGRLCTLAECGITAISLAGTGNQIGVDPLLGALASNGGPTQTRLPQLGSPAVGTGNNALALPNDQRGTGFPRTIGTITDAGATEYLYPAQCVGFNDVAGNNDAFCPSVAWLKNRSITLGCATGLYCPDAAVSRLAMAAFMQRLGGSLSGTPIVKAEVSGLLDFSTSPVVCKTDAIPASAAPRRAVLDAVFSGLAGADSFGRGNLVVSEDDGATWSTYVLFTIRTTFKANLWRSLHLTNTYDVEANKALRFGLMMDRPDTSSSGVLDSTCRLRVRMENSSGFTPS